MNTTETNEMNELIAANERAFTCKAGEILNYFQKETDYLIELSTRALLRTDLTDLQRLRVFTDFERLFETRTEDLRDALARELRYFSQDLRNIGYIGR